MKKKIFLTGIKPTGVPHIGNYLGAIQPALLASKESYQSFYFIADYHALNFVKDPKKLKQDSYEVAATWLACGLDTNKVIFYRESEIPQISELSILLSSFTSKGLLNRAHAYKAVVQDNQENNRDIDKNVNMGLFNYPLLMAADILLFQANLVPIGKDQLQHLEMTADIAESVNRNNSSKDFFTIPEALIQDNIATIIGLDGRKMSKSYSNTIPLFCNEKTLRKTIMKIKTNSQEVEEPKDPSNCLIFKLYKLFSNKEEQDTLEKKYLNGGMGWGEAKQFLFEKVNRHIKPMREKYFEIVKDETFIDKVLKDGKEKAIVIANKNLEDFKQLLGY